MTFREYVEDYKGRHIKTADSTPEDVKYGYAEVDANGEIVRIIDRTNPNAKWDWYEIGGRWTGFFQLKHGAEGTVGRPGLMTEAAKHGCADSAAKGDIDFEDMYVAAGNRAGKLWDRVHALLGPIADEPFVLWENMRENVHPGNIKLARSEYNAQPAVLCLRKSEDTDLRWIDVEDFITGTRSPFMTLCAKQSLQTFAVLKDGKWYERGEMGWWGCIHDGKTDDTWEMEYSDLLESVADDVLLTVVDCHT